MNALHSVSRENASWFPSPEIQQKILKCAEQFQMRPGAAIEALNLIQDPDCSIRELVVVAHRDVRLTTDILKIANSALFGARSNISSLDQAVMRLGLPRCKNITLACVVSSMLKKPTAQADQIADSIWKHSLMTATIATHLNLDLGIGLMGEEYAGGLIHDLGRLLLSLAMPEKAREADPMDFDESSDVLGQERSILGTTHADVGAWFAQDMRFPASLVTCIRCHHRPEDSDEHLCLTALIGAADHVDNYYHRFNQIDDYQPDLNPSIALLEEHGVFDAKLKLQYSFPSMMEKVLRDVKDNH